jgi:AraC family transcriptional regulator of adaptative response/methylated-DNA-[protein]-cysteine methyltransferase
LAGAFDQLREGGAVDDAVFDTGYESHSGFRDAFSQGVWDSPGSGHRGQLRAGHLDRHTRGADDRRRGRTPVSACLSSRIGAGWKIRSKHCSAGSARHWRLAHIRCWSNSSGSSASTSPGRGPSSTVPLHAPGTPFEERVWRALSTIPVRRDAIVRGHRARRRLAQSGARRRSRPTDSKPHRHRHSLPPRGEQERGAGVAMARALAGSEGF